MHTCVSLHIHSETGSTQYMQFIQNIFSVSSSFNAEIQRVEGERLSYICL